MVLTDHNTYIYYSNKRKLQKLLFISLEMDHIEIGREETGDEGVAITTIKTS